MVDNPPKGQQRVTPYLLYEDVAAALDWLHKAYGFEESMRMAGADGKVAHAEMRLADGVVYMGCPGPEYRNPKRLGAVTQHLYVYVDRIDEHFARAKAAGAVIIEEPADQYYGDRRYAAEDPEGHTWYFAEHVRDVSPDEMQSGSAQG